MVVMTVGQEYIGDVDALLAGKREYLLDLPGGIDNRGGSRLVIVHKVYEVFHRSEFARMNREIANSSDQQGQSANQVSQNVAAVSELSEKTADSSAVMADTSGQVNQLSVQLQELMSQFKV